MQQGKSNIEQVELSIIVPIYNGEEYIKNKIASLKDIKNLSYEVIISLNESSDKSEELLNYCINGNSRFKILKQTTFLPGLENYVRAFNVANGSFIMASAVDDICEKDFYREAIDMLMNTKDIVAVSPLSSFTDNSHGKGSIDFELIGSTENRLRTLFRNIRVSHGIFYSLMRHETASELNRNYVSTYSFIGGDWFYDTKLAILGKVLRSRRYRCIFEVKGISNSKNYLKGAQSNLIQRIFPYRFLAYNILKLSKKNNFKIKIILFVFAINLLKGNIHRFLTQGGFQESIKIWKNRDIANKI